MNETIVVRQWALKNGYAPSTARKYARILDIGQLIGPARVMTVEESKKLESALRNAIANARHTRN